VTHSIDGCGEFRIYLQLAMPMSVGLSDPTALRVLTLDVVRTLPTVWARSGFSIEYDIMRVIPDRDRQMAAWSARYQCVDHRDPDRLAECARNCLGGLGWLTIVSTALVDATQDDDLKAEVEREASALGTEGYLFEAGERPILGDSNRNEDPAEYRRVHRALRELYCDGCPPPPGLDDDPAWLRSQRFD
jgi:hypothetical protein